MKKILIALASSAAASSAFAQQAGLPAGVATEVRGYINEVQGVASAALLIAGGVALTMVVIKYVKRAGK